MKKTLFLSMIAATGILAASCSNDSDDVNVPSNDGAFSTFIAGNPGVGAGTRTEINYDGNVIDPWWSANDKLHLCQQISSDNTDKAYCWYESDKLLTDGKFGTFVIDDQPQFAYMPTLHEVIENVNQGKDLWTFAYVYPINGNGNKPNEPLIRINISNSISNLGSITVPGGGVNKIPAGTKLEKDFLIAKPVTKADVEKVDAKNYKVLLRFKRITSYLRMQFAGFAEGTQFKSIRLSTQPFGAEVADKYNFKGQLVCDMTNSEISYRNYASMNLKDKVFSAADGYVIPVMPGYLNKGTKLYLELVETDGTAHSKEITLNQDIFLESGVINTFNFTK